MIGKALRLTREFNRLKQVDLAKELKISTSYLSEIESGKKPPSLDLLDSYARIFKVPASTFLLFEEKASGRSKSNANAERLLKFFEWVISDEGGQDEQPQAEETTKARDPKKAVRAESMRTLRN